MIARGRLRDHLQSVVAVVLAFVCHPLWAAGPEVSATRPNIVLILADDMGYGDPTCYGTSQISTPHIDRLAREGMRFTDAHSPSAVCTPTRYALLTGRYAWRSRLKRGVLLGDSPALIEEGRWTLASLLKRKGYSTGVVGKWHLGLGDRPQTDYALPLTPGPLTVGFDWFFGIPASLDMPPYVYVENDRVVALPTARSEISPRKTYFEGIFWREGAAAPGFRHVDVLPTLAQRATEFIESQAADRPFFLYFPLTSPHTPWAPADAYRGQTAFDEYGDFLVQTDAVVGQLLAALDRRNMTEKTLVIFTSDNGAIPLPARLAPLGHRTNGALRGQKADLYEGGHRVPFLVRWPGSVPPGSRCDQTICHTDLLATLAAIVGEKLPDDAGEDSFSLLPVWRNPAFDRPIREATVHHSGSGAFAIRQGSWKAIFHLGSGGFTAPREEQAAPDGPKGQLYHLADDPEEAHNLWQQQPAVVERLTKLIEQYQNAGRSRT
ncbi:MAG: sulfatase family protein [Planctomycetaceae bacterium]